MSSKKIALNAIWSILGQLIPILVAVLTVPLLIKTLGLDRFGFLSLAWALVGYAGLFDFGISRAMTRLVAARLGSGDVAGAKHVAKVGTAMLTSFGLVVGCLMLLGSDWIVYTWLKLPLELNEEALRSLRLLAASIPLVLLTAAYRGVLEAWQEFRALNIIRIGMGLLTYMGPLAAALIVPHLEWVVGSIVFMRIFTTLLHVRACRAHAGLVLPWHSMDRKTVVELVSIGGWMSVSNLISPIMSYLDRFLIGGLVAMDVVAYYSTPYDMITRTMVLPYSVMAVIFPVLSGMAGDSNRSITTYSATIRMLMISMFPICFTAVILAPQLLTVWLGESFSAQATGVLQILAIGVLANTLAQAPANLIQSTGNPKWMSYLHILELPLFIGSLWFATTHWGILGTALCWTGRMIFDAIALYVIATKQLHKPGLPKSWYLIATICIATLLVAAQIQGTHWQIGAWLLSAALYTPLAWKLLLIQSDRTAITHIVQGRLGKPT